MITLMLLACAGPERVRVAPDMDVPVAAPVEATVVAALPPAAWNAGVYAGPAVLRTPVEVWSRMLPGPITEALATDGTRIYAVVEGRVYCYDLDGKPIWDVRPLASGGVAATDQGPVVGTETGTIVVLDPENGSAVRTTIATGPVRGAPVQLATSVAWATIHGSIASTADWGREVALSAAGGAAGDGEIVYITTLEGGLVAAGKDGVYWRAELPAAALGGPALDAAHIYVPVAASQGHPGGVVAFDRGGAEVWRRQSEFQPAGPLGVGAYVYSPDKDGHVYALDRATGEVVWAVEGFGEFTSQPISVDDQVYAGNGDGNLYRIDGADGGSVWKVPLGAAITGDPVYVGGKIVVGLANGRLVALAEGG